MTHCETHNEPMPCFFCFIHKSENVEAFMNDNFSPKMAWNTRADLAKAELQALNGKLKATEMLAMKQAEEIQAKDARIKELEKEARSIFCPCADRIPVLESQLQSANEIIDILEKMVTHEGLVEESILDENEIMKLTAYRAQQKNDTCLDLNGPQSSIIHPWSRPDYKLKKEGEEY